MGAPALLEVIDAFEAEASERVQEICDAARDADAAALATASHALNGAAANLGAAQVARLSGRLEELARSGALDGASALGDELARAVGDTPAALRAQLSA